MKKIAVWYHLLGRNKYNPLINYKWTTKVNNGNMELINSGTSGITYNAEMFSGEGVILDGTSYLDLTGLITGDVSMIYMLDGVATYTETPFYLINTGNTYKDLLYFSDTLTQAEITKYSTQPNAFFQDVRDGIIDNCVYNNPLDGTDEYTRNYQNYSETEIGTSEMYGQGSSGVTNTQITNGWNVVYTSGGQFNNFAINVSKDATICEVSFYATINSSGGDIVLNAIYDGTNKVYLGKPHIITNGLNQLIIPSTRTDNDTAFLYRDNTGDISFDIDFTFARVKELTGINEITNYTTSCRDTTLTLPYGSQEMKFKRDGLWRGSLSKYLELDGTQKPALRVPISDTSLGNKFAIEFVISGSQDIHNRRLLSSDIYNKSGIAIFTELSGVMRMYLYWDGAGIDVVKTVDSNYHHIIFENDGSNLTMIVDGAVGAPVAHSFVPSGLKFSDSTQLGPKGTLAMFKIWDEALFTTKYDRVKSVELGTKIVAQAGA